MNISNEAIYRLYSGFYISGPIGNNAFSFNQRTNQSIYIPPLVKGKLSDVQPGNTVAFSEIVADKEYNHIGLKQFVHLDWKGKQVFIFDNHNHAFFFWHWAFSKKLVQAKCSLLHIDQHKDIRKPEIPPSFTITQNFNLKTLWKYTNEVLNVGNFIPPAQETGLIGTIHFIDDSTSFNTKILNTAILDLDLDIFAPEMNYIEFDIKMNFIKSALQKSDFITIATSPFFMDQTMACQILYDIFE
jgi:hypothetical protein